MITALLIALWLIFVLAVIRFKKEQTRLQKQKRILEQQQQILESEKVSFEQEQRKLQKQQQILEDKEARLKQEQNNLQKQQQILAAQEIRLKQEQKNIQEQKQAINNDKQAFERLLQEKSIGFPWLAQAYADYLYLKDLQVATGLEIKSPPALKAAETVRQLATEKRQSEKLYRTFKYQLNYYENLFPWIIDFKDENIDELLNQQKSDSENSDNTLDDPAKSWLTKEEYSQLTPAEKNQLALDRYWQRKKSNWEIGKDYERYVGYIYEIDGWQVQYQGIIKGFSDLGRDLIAKKKGLVEIIQCKCWSKNKIIHEKHIFQLYGTKVAYEIDNSTKKNIVKAVFFTSTLLSERAKLFANLLKIDFKEQFLLQKYSCIKCNISHKDGTKIYHLPFDQQYDKVSIELKEGECYVATIREAESLGFRRAFRWRGN